MTQSDNFIIKEKKLEKKFIFGSQPLQLKTSESMALSMQEPSPKGNQSSENSPSNDSS